MLIKYYTLYGVHEYFVVCCWKLQNQYRSKSPIHQCATFISSFWKINHVNKSEIIFGFSSSGLEKSIGSYSSHLTRPTHTNSVGLLEQWLLTQRRQYAVMYDVHFPFPTSVFCCCFCSLYRGIFVMFSIFFLSNTSRDCDGNFKSQAKFKNIH